MMRSAVLRGLATVSLLWVGQGAAAADPPPPSRAGHRCMCRTALPVTTTRGTAFRSQATLAKRTPEEVVVALATGCIAAQSQ